MRCLLDTSAAYAVSDSRDDHHAAAAAWAARPGFDYFTTGVVQGELYTLLRRRRGYRVAMDWIAAASANDALTVIDLDGARLVHIWDTLRRHAGVPLSYADASLVVLGQLLAIDTVFSFDDDFRRAGLKTVPV